MNCAPNALGFSVFSLRNKVENAACCRLLFANRYPRISLSNIQLSIEKLNGQVARQYSKIHRYYAREESVPPIQSRQSSFLMYHAIVSTFSGL